jgi:hypothetical protein
MPGDVGLVSKAIETIFSYFTDEDGYKEMAKRAALKKKKEECRRALIENRFVDLARLTAELERLSQQS